MPDRMLDVGQVAKRLHVSPSTVRRWCEGEVFEGAYNAGTRSQSYWKIPEASLSAIRVQEGTPEGLEGATRA